MALPQSILNRFQAEYCMSIQQAADLIADGGGVAHRPQSPPLDRSLGLVGRGCPSLGHGISAEECHRQNMAILQNW